MGSPNCPMVLDCGISPDSCDCDERIYCDSLGESGHTWCGYTVVDGIYYANFFGGQGSEHSVFKPKEKFRNYKGRW